MGEKTLLLSLMKECRTFIYVCGVKWKKKAAQSREGRGLYSQGARRQSGPQMHRRQDIGQPRGASRPAHPWVREAGDGSGGGGDRTELAVPGVNGGIQWRCEDASHLLSNLPVTFGLLPWWN